MRVVLFANFVNGKFVIMGRVQLPMFTHGAFLEDFWRNVYL